MAFNLANLPPEFLQQLQARLGNQGSQNSYQGGNPDLNSLGNYLRNTPLPTSSTPFKKSFTEEEEADIIAKSLGPKKPVFGQNTEEEILAASLSTPEGRGKIQLAMDENLWSQQLANDPRLNAMDDDALTPLNIPTGQQIEKNTANPLEALGSTNWTGALIGAGAGIINELLGVEDEVAKQQQQWLDQMEARNQANNETIRATNSEANRRGAMLGLQDAKAGTIAQAANIGAGQALGSGLGGDISSEQIAGVKAAAPVMAAAGQFGQAEAGLMAQKANEDAQRNQALIQNQQAGTDIENQRLYLNKRKGSNWLNAIAGGTGIWKNILDSMSKSTGTHT